MIIKFLFLVIMLPLVVCQSIYINTTIERIIISPSVINDPDKCFVPTYCHLWNRCLVPKLSYKYCWCFIQVNYTDDRYKVGDNIVVDIWNNKCYIYKPRNLLEDFVKFIVIVCLIFFYFICIIGGIAIA